MTDRLALIAHELRSPVAALVAISETVAARRGRLGARDARRLLVLAVAAGRDVERIVLDATPASLRLERVDPAQLVLDVVAASGLRRQAVEADPGRDLPALRADPVRLRQALANLVDNAVAHSPPGAVVVVSARQADGLVRLAVADRGEGIPAERLELVLQPGVRFADRPGQGIGLAVARTIADAHGGSLEIESAPGRGSIFTLVLPLASGTA
ncbi:MAG TPA: ATP-binding protein [Gaiellaceae bacterium]|jgi:two-component system sensor histidine kinase BaeS